MESKKVVVVGGVAGGMSFATRYRRLNQNDEIVVVDKGPYVSFANCGLPYHISGEILERDQLLVAKKDMLESRFQLDVRVNHEVLNVDTNRNLLKVLHDGIVKEMSYDTLVLSPGTKAIMLDIEGMNTHSGIYTLRNLPDMDQVLNHIETKNPKSAVVIGAGFIGLEMAEALHNKGLKVSVVEKAPHVLGPLDIEMANVANETLKTHGIQSYTGTSIIKIEDDIATLEDGSKLEADIIIMAVGVIPATDFLKGSGIELNNRGSILIDEHYKTNIHNVYAVGDAILTYNAINNQEGMIALASPANRQGRHLADNLSGIRKPNNGSLGTAIVRVFDMAFASTGLNERQLKGRNIHIMHLKGNQHAGYFPGSSPINLKLIFDKDTHMILGAQAYGKQGVDKRMDVIATAIRSKMPVTDLQDLELSYAPPFGSAKDIVNMAGYVAENLILGTTQTIQWHEVETYQNNDSALILDVRTQEEYEMGSIRGSIHIPLDSLRCGMNTLPSDKEIIVYCASGVRSYNAESILRNAGFNVKNLDGAYGLYESAHKGR